MYSVYLIELFGLPPYSEKEVKETPSQSRPTGKKTEQCSSDRRAKVPRSHLVSGPLVMGSQSLNAVPWIWAAGVSVSL